MKHILASAILTSVVLVSACSGGGSDDASSTADNAPTDGGPTGDETPAPEGDNPSTTPPATAGSNVTAFGTISASYDALDDETEWSASFFSSPTSFPTSSLEQEYIPTSANSCAPVSSTIPDFEPDNQPGGDPGNLPFIPQTVSAGEVITLSSPSGTYTSLTPVTMFGFIFYQTQDDVPVAGAMPSGLVLDIPGAAGGFPAAANIAMPIAKPVEFTINGSTITWTNSGETGATINITLSALPNGDVTSQAIIECDLDDDGSHDIAAGILPAGNLEYPLFLGNRNVSRLTQVGTSALILTAEADGFLTR